MADDRTVGDILADLDANPRTGDNNPPEPTPFEAHSTNIADLYLEAEHWLDGAEPANQQQADAVTAIRDAAKKTGKAADAQRAVEKKPHDDAGKAVQATWKPLMEKAEKIERAASGALSKWLIAEQTRQRAKAERLAREAREAEDAARAAHQAAAQDGDLAAVEAADTSVAAAKALAKDARATDREKPIAKVEGMARGVGLRTVWDVAIAAATEDMPQPDRELMRWAWTARRADVTEFCLSLARDAVRKGGRTIPGCDVTSRQTV